MPACNYPFLLCFEIVTGGMCQVCDENVNYTAIYKLTCQNFDSTVKYRRNDLIKQDRLYNYHRVVGTEIIGVIPVCTPVIFPAVAINKVPEPVFTLTQQSKG